MSQEKLETTTTSTKNYSTSPLWLQSMFTGSVAGATEVLVDHPLWTIKTCIQSGEPISWNLRMLYRGVLPNAASMIPITAAQVTLNNYFRSFFASSKQELSPLEQLSCAFGAGVGSAAFSGPTEMVMTHQGKMKQNFFAASQYLINQHSWRSLFSGLGGTAMRDGIFASSFLALTPLLKQQILPWVQQQSLPPFISKDYTSSLLAGIVAGVIATITSHPFDTVKTIQQAGHLTMPENVLTTMKKLYTEKGVSGFFKGALPRGTRVVSAVTIIGGVTEKVSAYFKEPEHQPDVNEQAFRPSR